MQKLSKTKGLAHQQLMDVIDEVKTNLKYRCLADPDLVRGTSSAYKIKMTNSPAYLNNGIFYTGSAAEVAFTADDHDIEADASTVREACYLVCIVGDVLSITMGEIVDGAGNALLPDIPSGKTPLGYLRLGVDAGAVDFDATSTLLSNGALTEAYVDLGFLSPRFDAAQ